VRVGKRTNTGGGEEGGRGEYAKVMYKGEDRADGVVGLVSCDNGPDGVDGVRRAYKATS
jgi:hypothetical protein